MAVVVSEGKIVGDQNSIAIYYHYLCICNNIVFTVHLINYLTQHQSSSELFDEHGNYGAISENWHKPY